MSKMWLVLSHEFKQNVFKKSFIIVLLIVPLIIALVIGMGILIESTLENDSPLGYVDESGLLDEPIKLPDDNPSQTIPILPFESQETARTALNNREVQAYYVLEPDYFETGNVKLIYFKTPGENASRAFRDYLQFNLLVDLDPDVAIRLTLGSSITVHALDDDRTFPGGNPTLGSLVPLFLSLAFIGLIITGGGYIIQSIFKERQNRTIEILSTSLSPGHIVWGKVLGTVSINFIQLSFWILVAVIAVYVAGNWFDLAWFQEPKLEWANMLKFLVIAIPAYVFVVALTFSIGLIVGTQQDSERIGPFLMIAFILPIYFFGIIGEEPGGNVAVLMTLFPFTSLFTFGMRSIMIIVPLWQVAASSAIQILAVLVCLWFAVRIFKTGWLRPGFRLRGKSRKKREETGSPVTNINGGKESSG